MMVSPKEMMNLVSELLQSMFTITIQYSLVEFTFLPDFKSHFFNSLAGPATYSEVRNLLRCVSVSIYVTDSE